MYLYATGWSHSRISRLFWVMFALPHTFLRNISLKQIRCFNFTDIINNKRWNVTSVFMYAFMYFRLLPPLLLSIVNLPKIWPAGAYFSFPQQLVQMMGQVSLCRQFQCGRERSPIHFLHQCQWRRPTFHLHWSRRN